MAARTTSIKVQELLGYNYDRKRAPVLTPFIDTATLMVDDLVACAVERGITLTTARLELIERWLACYYYSKQDPLYSSRSTEGASGSFLRTADDFKNSAIDLDNSGCLQAMFAKAVASLTWLGKVPSEQIDVNDRD